jgi:hypothetical protein
MFETLLKSMVNAIVDQYLDGINIPANRRDSALKTSRPVYTINYSVIPFHAQQHYI